jgi:hypothetical protein
MPTNDDSVYDDSLSEEQILRLLDHALKPADQRIIGDWLGSGKRLHSRLLEALLSDSSKLSYQSLDVTRPVEQQFLTSLCSVLNIGGSHASQLLSEYRKQNDLLGSIELNLESFQVLEDVRNFYYTQQQFLWKILQELLRIDKDEDHHCFLLARSNVQYLMSKDLLKILLTRAKRLQHWQPTILSKSQFSAFSSSNPPSALVDTRCCDFIGRHQLSSAEFAANDLEITLETLILLLYTHCSLDFTQLETLLTDAARDSYGSPRGCKELVQSILGGNDDPFKAPFQHSKKEGFPALQGVYKKLDDAISMKYIVILAESLQFWRVLQPPVNWEELGRHPLLDNYVHSSMKRFTTSLTTSFENLSKSDSMESCEAHTTILFLWGLFLEMFGSLRGAESVSIPSDFSSWVCGDDSGDELKSTTSNQYALSIRSTKVGIAEQILSRTDTAGALQSLVSILTRVIGLSTHTGGGDEGLGAILGMRRASALPGKSEGYCQGGNDLILVCTVLQETVNVIIATVTLAHGSIDQLMNTSLLIELTHRGDDDLCRTFWSEWDRRQSSDNNERSSTFYPLCQLLETLLENTPHEPTYLLSILSSLACSPSKCMAILEILNQQVSVVKWIAVKNLLFLETRSSSRFDSDRDRNRDRDRDRDRDGDEQWVDIATWKDGRSTFLGATVVYSSSSSSEHLGSRGPGSMGELKDILNPQEGSRGVVCSVPADGKEVLLVRWEDQVLWWGVILDTIAHAPSVANTLTSSATLHASSEDVIKTSVAFRLLSMLMSKQRLLTGFYLESKAEQLMLHSVLMDIGGSHLFDILSMANETVVRILTDPQKAYIRLTGNSIRMPHDEAVKLITLLQDHAKSRESSVAIFSSIPAPQGLSYSSSESQVSYMLASTIVSAACVLSKHTRSTTLSLDTDDKMLTKSSLSDAFLLATLQFLTSFASSSPSWSCAVCKAIATTFDSTGPSSFAESMYRMSRREGSAVSPTQSAIKITEEVCHLVQALLQTSLQHSTNGTDDVKMMILSLINYLIIVFINAEQASTLSEHQSNPSRCVGWKGELILKCLAIFRLILSKSSNTQKESINVQGGQNMGKAGSEPFSAYLIARLIQDTQLLRSISSVATDISRTAVILTPLSQPSVPVTAAVKKRVFKARAVSSNGLPDSLLPINHSLAFSSLTSDGVVTCLGISVAAIEVLSLALNVLDDRDPDSLPVILSFLAGRIEQPLGTANYTVRALEDCPFLTLLCGLLQTPDKLAVGGTGLTELRWYALRLLTDVILRTRSRLTQVTETAPSLTDSIGNAGLNELCVSLCELINYTGACDDRRGAVAAFDLLLAIGQEQPFTLVMMLNFKNANEGSGGVTDASSGDADLGSKMGMLMTTVHSLLLHASALYKKHPLLLHKLYEFIILLWRSSSSVPPLGLAAVRFIQAEPKFFSLITVPLSENVSDAPNLVQLRGQGASSVTAESTASVEGIMRAAIEGAVVSELLSDFKKPLRTLEKTTNDYCFTLLTHASALQIVALERHGHLFSMDAATARKADTEMRAYFQSATEKNRFYSFLKSYMHVSINDGLGDEVATAGRNIGIDLATLVYSGSHIAGAIVGSRTAFGAHYIYDTDLLHDRVVSVFEKRCLALDDIMSPASAVNDLTQWTAFEEKVHVLNLQWSLADAQMVVLQSWKVFIQIFVLPGSSLRQIAYKAQYEHNCNGSESTAAGDGWTPPGSPAAGSLSPSFDPVTGSPSGSIGSKFAGDKRSYELVHEISKHLIAAISTTSGTEISLENRSVVSSIGVGAARVLLEKSELLASMLHHQLREVLVRTSDPRRSQVDTRHLGSSRLSPEKMKVLLVSLSKCYTAIMAGLSDHPVSLMRSTAQSIASKGKQQEMDPRHLRRSIQRQLFIALILTLRGIVQLDSAPLFPGRSRTLPEEESMNSTVSPTSLIRLQIFSSAMEVVKQESEAEGGLGQDTGPGSLFEVALRLMRCCLPVHVSGLSLSTALAWRAEAARPQAPLPAVLMELLQNLSQAALKEGVPALDHDYTLWGSTTKCGQHGSDTTSLSFIDASDAPSSSAAALSAALDIVHGGISSGVLELSQAVGVCQILRVFRYLGVFQELQRVLTSQPLSRSAALMGYSSRTGEISDLVKCWERVLNTISLIITLSAPEGHLTSTELLMKQDEEKVKEHEAVRELTFNGVVAFLQVYGPLLMLPLTQSFSHDNSGVSRLSIRRMQLCRSSVTLLSVMTQQFRVWRAVVPGLYDACVLEALRASSVFITLLTDVKQEDKGPLNTPYKEAASEEKDVVSTPGGGIVSKRGPDSAAYTQVTRAIFDHAIAVSCDEKEDAQPAYSFKKRRSSNAKGEREGTSVKTSPTIGGLGKKAGLRVTFNDNINFQSAPRLSVLDDSQGTASQESKGRDETPILLSADFILSLDREIISSTVSLLIFIRDVSPESGIDFTLFDGSAVCVGSKVFYYSRAYELATRSIQLLEGMVVAINPQRDGTRPGAGTGAEAGAGAEGYQSLEVVLANGAREFDVTPSDVVYSSAPLLSYQRLKIPYPNIQEIKDVNRGDDFLFSMQDGAVVSVEKGLVARSVLSGEIWSGAGLGVVPQGALVPVTTYDQRCLEGKESVTTAHLLRILAFATSKVTYNRFIESDNLSSLPSHLSSLSSAPHLLTPSTSSSSFHSSSLGEEECELEALGGLSSWMCLGAISQHAHAFVPRRCTSSFAYIGGRPGMIEQLEYLKSFLLGDSRVLGPPKWLVSEHWKQYCACTLSASEAVIERLRDRVVSPVAVPEAPPAELKKGTRINLRNKLQFISTPEEL